MKVRHQNQAKNENIYLGLQTRKNFSKVKIINWRYKMNAATKINKNLKNQVDG